jgi:hypothetical protein
VLAGETFKIKTPLSDHALYVTINDIVLNQGTKDETYQPFEVFINSKDMKHFQWIIAMTRIISAIFRKGGEVNFLIEELRSVFDPSGGYFKKGGKFMPSLVAEIGDVIEQHFINLGLMKKPELDQHQQQLVKEARAKAEKMTEATSEFPDSAVLCAKCGMKAAVLLDGCFCCLNCGDSKCG